MLFALPDAETLYAALLERDPAYDGHAFVGVTTTRVFCRLTCPARKPRRENARFFPSIPECFAAGFRPCLRCRPLEQAGMREPLVAALLAELNRDPGKAWSEDGLAAMGFEPSTVRRAFQRAIGMTFLDLARLRRTARSLSRIEGGGSVIDAQLDAGFESGSGFRAAVAKLVGESPAGLKGRDLLKADWISTPIGTMLAVADGHALHLLEFLDRRALPGELSRLRTTMRSAIAFGRSPLLTPQWSPAMDRAERARLFAACHIKGRPVVLTNVWDAGSAKAVADAGAGAIATGSWSMAAAQGYEDGERMPLDLVEAVVGRIVRAVALPVTVDLEGGYAVEPEAVADNVARIAAVGAVGVNIEDRVVGGSGLHPVADQCRRLSAVRRRADGLGLALWLNARTDLFLQAEAGAHGTLLTVALNRAEAYAKAGASSFFVPGLADDPVIRELCATAALPVNVMALDAAASVRRLAGVGVARVSEGPGPFMRSIALLRAQAENAALQSGDPSIATRLT